MREYTVRWNQQLYQIHIPNNLVEKFEANYFKLNPYSILTLCPDPQKVEELLPGISIMSEIDLNKYVLLQIQMDCENIDRSNL